MQVNKTFKGMQNENTALRQDYENLMKDFVEVCKSERKANDMIRMFVSEFLMPQMKTNVRPQSDNSLCAESGSFWHGKYKEACDQITKLLQSKDFAMGDLKAEISIRQKAEAENLVLKDKIDALENDLETAKSQVEMHAQNANDYCSRYMEAKSEGVFVVHEMVCNSENGTSFQVGCYTKEKDAIDYANDLKSRTGRGYQVFKKVSIKLEKSKLPSDESQAEQDSDNPKNYFTVYERTQTGEMDCIGVLSKIEQAEKLARDFHEINPDKSHWVYKKVLFLNPETNKK